MPDILAFVQFYHLLFTVYLKLFCNSLGTTGVFLRTQIVNQSSNSVHRLLIQPSRRNYNLFA